MAQYDGSIRINTEINSKNASAQLMALENRIVKTADKISSLRSKMDSLKGAKIPTQEYKNLEKEAALLEKQLLSLYDRQEKFLETGGKRTSNTYKRMEYDAETLEQKLKQVEAITERLSSEGKAFTLGSDTQEYTNLAQQLKYAESEMEVLNQKHDIQSLKVEKTENEYKRLGNTAGNSLKKIASVIKNSAITSMKMLGNVTKKVGSSIKGVISKLLSIGKSSKSASVGLSSMNMGFKNLLKYGLGIRSLYVLVSKFRTAVKEGFQNLAQYSKPVNSALSSLKSSLTQLKNSLATAFAPILTAASPALTTLINMASKAATAVGMLIAALTGQKTFTKATAVQEDYAASLKKTSSEAKKANKQLSGLDKLNNLTTQDKDKDSGDGGISPSDMFETVEIPSSISDLAEKIKEVWGSIWDVFKKAWENKGQSVIDSAKAALGSLKEAAKAIGTTFLKVWTNGTGLSYVESLLELLRSALDVINSIASAFSTAWNSGAGEKVVTALFEMLTNVNTLLSQIATSFAEAFSSGVGVQIWTNILGIITGVFNIIGNLASQITKAWTNSGLGTVIWSGILGIINIILETINGIVTSTANWAKNLNFTPLLTSIQTLLTALQPLAENIGSGLKWFWDNVLLPVASWTIETAVPEFLNMLSAAIKVVNSAVDALKPLGIWLWESFLKPLGEWAGAVVIAAIKKLTKLFNDLAKWISDNKSKVVDFTKTLNEKFKAASDFLVPIITKWGKSFSDLWNNSLKPFITSFVKGIVDLGKDFLSVWNKYVNPLITKWATKFTDLWTKYVKPAISGIVKVCNDLWKDVLKPIVSWFIKQLVPKVTDAVDTIASIVSDAVENISTWVSGITDIIEGVITIIKALVKGDWKTVWEGFGNVVKGIKKVVKTPINAILGFVEKLVNGVISMINTMVRALNSISFEIPDWVPKVGGNKFGLDLKEIQKVTIPKLATGAVIPANKEFMAVLGDQKHGRNLEAPEDLIRKIVREETAKNNSAGGDVTIRVPVEVDGRVLFELMKKFDLEQYRRTGRPSFQM